MGRQRKGGAGKVALDDPTTYLIRGIGGAICFAILWFAARVQFRDRHTDDEPFDPGLD